MIKKFGLIHMIIILLVFGISCSFIGMGCSNNQSHVRDLPRLYQQTVSSVVMIKDCGSGLLISDEYVLTANHVIGYFSECIVQLSNGYEISATIYARDNFNDLALLKIDPNEIKFYRVPKLKIKTKPQVGEIIFAIGSPYMEDEIITMGVISRRAMQYFSAPWRCEIYLSDIVCDRGNSGSPVFNLQKKLIGIIAGFHNAFTVIIPSQAIHSFLKDNKVI